MSDPFQPCEEQYRVSYECLKVFAETGYPFIVSTKGKIIAEPEYLDLLKQCNAVVQISMVCDKFDKLEEGAPTYEERLEICKKVAPNCRRLIVRIQPYMIDVLNDVVGNIKRLKEAGVYGVVVEGFKSSRKLKGFIRVGGDFCYPIEILQSHFSKIKKECEKVGVHFFCGENRLRTMGESLCCCGCSDLEGFEENRFNLNHILAGEITESTENMKQAGTGYVFNSLFQQAGTYQWIAKNCFETMMLSDKVHKMCKEMMTIPEKKNSTGKDKYDEFYMRNKISHFGKGMCRR